jgi:hypothetical protein
MEIGLSTKIKLLVEKDAEQHAEKEAAVVQCGREC